MFFEPSLEGYVNLFTTRTRQTPEYMASLPPPATWYDELVRSRNMVITGPSRFAGRYLNSLMIGFGSTFLAVFLGTLAAYAFSRFRVPLKDDLLFFILSTRMMPPIAVAIPIFLMYRALGLTDTHLGMILLYTAVNISLSVWLLKGFIDEIPREYEDAAMVDGYTRFQAFCKVVLPQATTGIAATAIFCLIFSWNEYAFALLLTSGDAQTAPPFIPIIIGEGGLDWPAVAAGHHAVPAAGGDLHRPAAPAPAARHHLRRGAQMSAAEPSRHLRRWFRRGPWENAAMPLIALGVVMLMQPFSLTLFGYSFAVDPDRHDRLRDREPLPGGRDGRDPPRATCTSASATSSPCATRTFVIERRRVLRPARPLGLRQDDDAAHDRRPRNAERRPDPAGRRGRHLRARRAARHRLRVPALRALPAHERAPEPGLSAQGRRAWRVPRSGERVEEVAKLLRIEHLLDCAGRRALRAATGSASRSAARSSAGPRRS